MLGLAALDTVSGFIECLRRDGEFFAVADGIDAVVHDEWVVLGVGGDTPLALVVREVRPGVGASGLWVVNDAFQACIGVAQESVHGVLEVLATATIRRCFLCTCRIRRY